MMTATSPLSEMRLWLWKNFVDGRPEYWAFDNPFPTIDGGDPMTLGEPCGWAILKQSENGRPDVPLSKVEAAIKRASIEDEVRELREALENADSMANELIRSLKVASEPRRTDVERQVIINHAERVLETWQAEARAALSRKR